VGLHVLTSFVQLLELNVVHDNLPLVFEGFVVIEAAAEEII